MAEKISSNVVDEDDLLAEDDEDAIQEQEKETNHVKNVITNLSKSLQIMAGSMQAMEVSLKRLHSPASTAAVQPKKRRASIVDMTEDNDDDLSPSIHSIEPSNADSAEG